MSTDWEVRSPSRRFKRARTDHECNMVARRCAACSLSRCSFTQSTEAEKVTRPSER